jgi:hypothetical protein
VGEPAVNPGWRKSSHSNGGSGGCVEVGTTTTAVLMRDTTNRAGATLAITTVAWRTLLSQIRG